MKILFRMLLIWGITMTLFLLIISFTMAYSTNVFDNTYSSCYQEDVNSSSVIDGGLCGLNYSGNKIISPSNWYSDDGVTSCINEYIDGDYNTFCEHVNVDWDSISINYTIPDLTNVNSSKWRVKNGAGDINYSLNGLNCDTSDSKLKLFVKSWQNGALNQKGTAGYCLNYSGGQSMVFIDIEAVLSANGNKIYEEAMIWNSTQKILIFLGNQNITRYLSIHQNTILTNAYLNLSGIGSNYSNNPLCIQHYANMSSIDDGNCGLNYSGNYINYLSNANINSIGPNSGYFNYTKPLNYLNETPTYWSITTSSGSAGYYMNLTIPPSCLYSTRLALRFTYNCHDGIGYQNFSCLNNTGWYDIYNNNCGYNMVYWATDNIYWNSSFNATYPTNPSILIGNNQAWNYSGIFNTTKQTNSLINYLNSYLSSCIYIGGYCLVPFNFHSDSIGTLQYSNLVINNDGFIENNQSYNPTTYETTNEQFTLNLFFDPNLYTSSFASLIYNGTSYSSTKTQNSYGAIFSRSLLMSEPIGIKMFYWRISLTNSTGTYYFNSTNHTQTVSPVTFTLCNSTINSTYLNITFKDETTGLDINASSDLATFYLGNGSSKTYLYTNTSMNPSYAFCFSPNNLEIRTILQYFQYSSTGYPQRQYYFSGTLTNQSTNKVLYLLQSGSGIYTTFQVMTQANNPLPSATIQIERQFGGIWTLISQGVTDSSGSATFYLNPNYEHRITVTKSGYSSSQQIVKPAQSAYTIVLSIGSSNISYTNVLEGINYKISPKEDFLMPNTTYTFGLNITSSLCNLVNYKLEISNSSNILSYVEGHESCGSNLSLSINTYNYDSLIGKYYLDIGSGYYQLDPATFPVQNITDVEGSFYRALKNFMNNRTNIKDKYSQLWFFFFFLFIGVSAFCYFSGAELANPGINLIIIMMVVFIFSYVGYFEMTLTSNEFFNKFAVFLVSMFIGIGDMFRRMSG